MCMGVPCFSARSCPGVGGTRQTSAAKGVGRAQPGDGGSSWSPAPLQAPAPVALVDSEQSVGTHPQGHTPAVHTQSGNSVSQAHPWQEPAGTVPDRGWGPCWAPRTSAEEEESRLLRGARRGQRRAWPKGRRLGLPPKNIGHAGDRPAPDQGQTVVLRHLPLPLHTSPLPFPSRVLQLQLLLHQLWAVASPLLCCPSRFPVPFVAWLHFSPSVPDSGPTTATASSCCIPPLPWHEACAAPALALAFWGRDTQHCFSSLCGT